MQILLSFSGFDWDEGNSLKNQIKHKVSQKEAEDIFFNLPLLIFNDDRHSSIEARHHALGKADNKRLLQISFTYREQKIRVISARTMNKKERAIYETYSSI